jgi:hypothetical protein
MSSERLDELGVPRRAFLKKAGAAALAAPLIVSFGMDAVAEGSTRARAAYANQTHPTACYPNQIYANQVVEPGEPLNEILKLLLLSVFESSRGYVKPALGYQRASELASLATEAELIAADGKYVQSYNAWTQFIHEVETGAKLPEGLASQLVGEAAEAQEALNCN